MVFLREEECQKFAIEIKCLAQRGRRKGWMDGRTEGVQKVAEGVQKDAPA
jgi:hypothetical protein